ncbi:MAG: hypothetical protein HYV09_24475 [Deltaproteobacteria bacterium]|nr:hypothetical protein [Deltaproteobacteria bacterium]
MRLYFVLPLALSVVACANWPKRHGTPAATEEEAPAKKKAVAEDDEEKPKKKKKPAKKGFHWKGYAGPKAKTTVGTKMAWAVSPVGLDGNFGIAKIALLEFIKTEGDEHVFKTTGTEQLFVPQAMVRPTEKVAGVKKGTALFVNVAAASGFGRAVDAPKDDGPVKFQYEWGGQVSEQELPLDEVILLEDKIAFGHPVAIPLPGGAREVGTVIFSDATDTWVLRETGAPEKYPTADVRAMKVSKPLKKGDKVLAPSPFELKPGRVVDILENGVRYKVKADEGGKEETFSFHKVTAPL